jgi:hypothetical protein
LNEPQNCENGVHGEADGSQKSGLSNTDSNEDHDTNIADDHRSGEGTTTTQSAQGPVRFPFSGDDLERTAPLDTVRKNAASKSLELVHQYFAEIRAALSKAQVMFDQLSEGEVTKALLQSSPFARTSNDVDDDALEYTADIGFERLNWANSEGDAVLKEVNVRKVEVVSGSRRKSEMGLLSNCHSS